MLSDKLKTVRAKLGLKQFDVASAIGCASTSFTNWESGKVNPPLEQLEKICVIYKISPLDLLDHYPTMNEVHAILQKPLTERSYEETVAITFCGDITGWVNDGTTAEEDEVLRIYRRLDGNTKAIVLKMLSAL